MELPCVTLILKKTWAGQNEVGEGGRNQPHSYLYSLFLHHSSAVSLHRDFSNLTISLYLTSVQQCHLSGSAMKNINHRHAHKGRGRIYASTPSGIKQAASLHSGQRSPNLKLEPSLGNQEIHSLALKRRISPIFEKQNYTPSTSLKQSHPVPFNRTRDSTLTGSCTPHYPVWTTHADMLGKNITRSLNLSLFLPFPSRLNKAAYL